MLETLSPPEQHAVKLIKTALDCYNSYDGIGEFTGVARYQRLQDRLTLAATQSRNLFEFWANLCRRMRWVAPPKKFDEILLPLLQSDASVKVLWVLSRESASVIMLARYLHSEDKASRKQAEQAWDEVTETTEKKGGLFDEAD